METFDPRLKYLLKYKSFMEKKNLFHILPYTSVDPSEINQRLGEKCSESTFRKVINETIIGRLVSHPTEQVYQKFLDALRNAGMTKLYDMMKGKKVLDESIFEELVTKNYFALSEVNWHAVLNYYYENNHIELIQRNQLVSSLDSHQWTCIITYFSTTNNWFFTFIKCLKQLQEHKAVTSLSHLLYKADSDESLKEAIQTIMHGNEEMSAEIRSSLKENANGERIFYNYIKLFGKSIYNLDLDPIFDCLYEWKIFKRNNQNEERWIKTSQFNKVLYLLWKLKDNCGFHFIKALQECKEREALKALDFDIEDDDEVIKKKLDQIKNLDYKPEKKGGTKNDTTKEAVTGGLLVDGAVGGVSNNDLDIDAAKCRESKMTSVSELHQDSSFVTASHFSKEAKYDFRADDETSDAEESMPVLNKLIIKDIHSRKETLEILEPFLDLIEDLKSGQNEKSIDFKEDGSVFLVIKNIEYAEFIMDALKGNVPISYAEEKMTRPIKNVNEKIDAMSVTELKLRDYQKELTEIANNGSNCIIVAPTGSGKTHVAISIIKKHFERDLESKVIFIVPTVALVEQQKKQVQTYCKESVYGISGASDLSLEILIDKHDIFVVTPQILVNQLKNNPDFLTKLTLIIFDECHHTNKDHPYNSIMSNYINIRHTQQNNNLPQIVGFTASIGVGKSKTTADAIKHVKTICANLDSPNVCTVREHVKELDEHINKPDEDVMEIQGRTNDPFDREISKIMSDMEKQMLESPEKDNAEKEIKNFGKELKTLPSERGNDPYTQWLSRMRRFVCTIHKQDTRMYYITIIDYLMMYNNSLMINADCRTKDAVNYIQNKIYEENYPTLPLPNGLNKILVQQWNDKYEYLNEISKNQDYRNPKLEKIKHFISNCYSENVDSRVILFCKTREMATALVNWMNETPELQQLNPTKLVGSNAPTNRAGMTSVQQDDVLKYFRNGEHKIIIATSVAEEGLDVQKCNMVIRYEHVTNSISRVQTRGRARKDNAKYVLIAEKGRGAAEKEEKNAIHEEMMKRAISQFQTLGLQERKNSIYELQRESLISRRLTECGKKKALMDLASKCHSEREFELRCVKCDQFAAMSSEVRKIEESHHVITDPGIKERIEIRPHPKTKTQKLSFDFEKTGKIHCAKCKLDWGIMALYRRVPFPVIKISSFVVKIGLAQKNFKQWKDVPFPVTTLTVDEMEIAASSHTFPQDDQWNQINVDRTSNEST